MTIDTTPPTASLTMSDWDVRTNETATVNISFSEPVTGLTLSDFTVENGTLTSLIDVDGEGITWTATYTPNDDVVDSENYVTLNASAVTDLAGNFNSGPASTGYFAVNTPNAAPTASILFSNSVIAVNQTSVVNITFSEMVTGLTESDFTVTNGTISGLSSSDEGIHWTGTYTPNAGVQEIGSTISLNMTGVQDLAGKAGVGTATGNYSVDTKTPTAQITMTDSHLTGSDTSTVTIHFDEMVNDFDIGDLAADNGTLSALAMVDEGSTWTATYTPNAAVGDDTNTITVDNSGVSDLFGNTGTGTSSSENFAIDTLGPVPTITVSDTVLKAGDTAEVQISFTEAVSDLTSEDITVEGGTLTAPQTSDGGLTYTATLTPNAETTDYSNLITINNAGLTDAEGNAGTGTTSSLNYTVDTVGPAAPAMSISAFQLSTGQTAVLTISFAEPVTNFTIDDLNVDNGTLTTLTNTDGEGLTWTATYTPNTDVLDSQNYITLNTSNVTDLAGNAGANSVASTGYFGINTVNPAPTATVTLADSTLTAGETTAVNIVFSEIVTGLTVDDLTVGNGTVTDLASSDEGLSWTGTFTPTAGVQASNSVIEVNLAGVKDGGDKAGVGSASSAVYVVDTKAPTAVITMSDTALNAGDTSEVTITFDEYPVGFTADDLTVSNGTLGTLTQVNEGPVWTGTFTPNADTTDFTNAIVLDNTGVADSRGNAGTGTTSSGNYTIDNEGPSATITVPDFLLTTDEALVVTIAFDEAVSDFTLDDLAVENGTLSNLLAGEGGLTWTATLTPDADITDVSNSITLDKAGISDTAGNAGAGTTASNSFAIDTKAPAATISMADSALAIGETSLVTITFSESVTQFDAADLTVENGTLSALASVDEGMTWTATFTPAAEVADTTNVITLNNTGVADYSGNAGTGSTVSENYTVATVLPTPTPTPSPVAPGSLVDGVKVVTKTTTAADGSKTEVITIPTVVGTRTNTEGATATADIPLVTGAGGARVLEAGVPTGIGLQVSGSAAAKDAPASLAGLIAAIEARTTTGSQEQSALVAGGSDFLGSLASDVPMFVRTIVATSSSSANASGALVISGAVQTAGSPQTALVIDASGLAAGSSIQLQNVEFAAVIGNVNLTGGAGSQHVWGDSASQTIFLGADDDVLHGGAGDDTVGSAGGNDQVFGDEGNDVVFGGIGNDLVDGGTGRDTVQLAGAGRADYAMRVVDGQLVMTQRNGGVDGTDTVRNVEVLRFSGAAADVDFNDIDVASVVRLYDTAFGRAADEDGINFWIERAEAGVTLAEIAAGFVASAEARPQYASLSNEAYVAALYVDGLGRSGSAAEVQWWVDHLNHGDLTRGETLLAFADSAEKIALIGVIDTSITTI